MSNIASSRQNREILYAFICKRRGEGIYLRVFLSSNLMICSLDGSDFLAHKDEIADPEREKRDGHNRYQVRNHDNNTLKQGKGALESGERGVFPKVP